MACLAMAGALDMVAVEPAVAAVPPGPTRLSVSSGGAQGNGASFSTTMNRDGSRVAFDSTASNLVPGDANGVRDVFLRDVPGATLERVSVSGDGTEGNGDSMHAFLTVDGTKVAFTSSASNLVADDTNGWQDIFVRDLLTGTTTRLSLAGDGGQANGPSDTPTISADGSVVAFRSSASNLVPGDTNNRLDLFVRELGTGVTTRVSVATDGSEANDHSALPALSADGSVVAYESSATNLVAGDTNGGQTGYDIFVRDRGAATTTRVSVASDGREGDENSEAPSISADGRLVAFASGATTLVPGDVNISDDIFVRDRLAGTTTLVSRTGGGVQANGISYSPSISADGTLVAYDSSASNLAPDDRDRDNDVFVQDLRSGTVTLVSVAGDGTGGDRYSSEAEISADGSAVAFDSEAANLVAGDTNEAMDVFVRGYSPGEFHALAPTRILDTRLGLGGVPGPVGPGSFAVRVTDTAGVPATGVAAVVLNVTAVAPTAASYLTVWPAGTALPATSNLNVVAGQTVANLVTVKVGSGGRVSVYNDAGRAHVLFDVAGWYGAADAPNGSRYTSMPPSRVLDTRTAVGGHPGALTAGETVAVPIRGQGGVPATGVSAVVVNATVVDATASSFLTLYPSGGARPVVSNLNYRAGQTVPNLATVRLGADGRLAAYNDAGGAHLVFDVLGWFGDEGSEAGGAFNALTPARILDTRSAIGGVLGPVGPARTIDALVTGVGGVPSTGVDAVVVNATVVAPTAAGYVTVWPAGAARPLASNLNFVPAQTVPNLAVVKVGAGGRLSLFNATGRAHLILDVVGWYAAAPR